MIIYFYNKTFILKYMLSMNLMYMYVNFYHDIYLGYQNKSLYYQTHVMNLTSE